MAPVAWPAGTSPATTPHHLHHHPLSQERHSYELGHRTLPRSFKSRSPTSSWNHSSSSSSSSTPLRRKARERADPVGREGEEPTTPVAPPRAKKLSTSSSHRTPCSPRVSSTEPSSSQASPLAPASSVRSVSGHTYHHHRHHPAAVLKHSNTFASHIASAVTTATATATTSTGDGVTSPSSRKMQTKGCGFSQSMGALSKPLIEPKVSASNPNVIHV